MPGLHMQCEQNWSTRRTGREARSTGHLLVVEAGRVVKVPLNSHARSKPTSRFRLQTLAYRCSPVSHLQDSRTSSSRGLHLRGTAPALHAAKAATVKRGPRSPGLLQSGEEAWRICFSPSRQLPDKQPQAPSNTASSPSSSPHHRNELSPGIRNIT